MSEKTFWLRKGRPIITADGRPFLCGNCPCGGLASPVHLVSGEYVIGGDSKVNVCDVEYCGNQYELRLDSGWLLKLDGGSTLDTISEFSNRHDPEAEHWIVLRMEFFTYVHDDRSDLIATSFRPYSSLVTTVFVLSPETGGITDYAIRFEENILTGSREFALATSAPPGCVFAGGIPFPFEASELAIEKDEALFDPRTIGVYSDLTGWRYYPVRCTGTTFAVNKWNIVKDGGYVYSVTGHSGYAAKCASCTIRINHFKWSDGASKTGAVKEVTVYPRHGYNCDYSENFLVRDWKSEYNVNVGASPAYYLGQTWWNYDQGNSNYRGMAPIIDFPDAQSAFSFLSESLPDEFE